MEKCLKGAVYPLYFMVQSVGLLKSRTYRGRRSQKWRMIRSICGHIKLNKIRNEVIRGKLEVASIEDKISDVRLRWVGHIRRRSLDEPMRRCEKLECMDLKRSRGRSKKNWSEVLRHDLKTLGLVDDMAQDRKLWKSRIHVVDSK